MEPADRDPSALKLDGGGTVSMGRLLTIFLKIGSIGFGGGMAVIALMEKEFVRKRRLIPLDEFVHSVGLGQVLGSFAVNVAIFIGYRLFGVPGALLSAGAFLAPSIALVIVLSDLYFRYHAVPALQSAVAGLAPVVIALILDAGWSIGRKVLRSWPAMLIAAGALVAGIAQWNAVLGARHGRGRRLSPAREMDCFKTAAPAWKGGGQRGCELDAVRLNRREAGVATDSHLLQDWPGVFWRRICARARSPQPAGHPTRLVEASRIP
jgi:chromate transporter